MLAKTGPAMNSNRRRPVSGSSWRMSVPVMSEGIRSGVNWIRRNERPRMRASVLTSSVLASPGTPTSRTWPRAKRPVRSCSTTSCWPTITLPISCAEPAGLLRQRGDGRDLVGERLGIGGRRHAQSLRRFGHARRPRAVPSVPSHAEDVKASSMRRPSRQAGSASSSNSPPGGAGSRGAGARRRARRRVPARGSASATRGRAPGPRRDTRPRPVGPPRGSIRGPWPAGPRPVGRADHLDRELGDDVPRRVLGHRRPRGQRS